MGNICKPKVEAFVEATAGVRPDEKLSNAFELIVVKEERMLDLQRVYYDEFEYKIALHGYGGLIDEEVLKTEV